MTAERPYGPSGMQVSRYWRMTSQLLRLEGIRYQNGEVSLQIRPTPPSTEQQFNPLTFEALKALGSSKSSK